MGTQIAASVANKGAVAHHFASRTQVLLIGNMHRVGDALRRACAPGDYHLSLEADAQAGLAQASRTAYDLIVVDLLFLTRGVALCWELRAGGVRAPILLLAITGSAAEVIAGLDAGADDCIAGAVADEEVRARAAGILRRRGPRAQAGAAGPVAGADTSADAEAAGARGRLEPRGEGARCRA